MNYALIPERPLMVLPTLVRMLNLEKALILQQIHFHSQAPRSGREIDGYHWIWNTYEDWRQDFPFWKERTIQKWILQLEKAGFLVSKQYDLEEWNARKYYRIDYEYLEKRIAQVQPIQVVHVDASPKKENPKTQRKHIVHVDAPVPLHVDASANIPNRARSIHEQRLLAETTSRDQIREESLKPSLAASAAQVIAPLFSASPTPSNTEATDRAPLPVQVSASIDSFDGGESSGGILPQAALNFGEAAPTTSLGLKIEPTPVSAQMRATSQTSKTRSARAKTAKASADPRASHPAIAAVRELTKRFPKDILWDKIIERLGDSPDMDKLRACYLAHVERGYNPNSWIWATEWYGAGISNSNVKQKKERTFSGYEQLKAADAELKRTIREREGIIRA